MTREEMIKVLIDQYADYQEIRKSTGPDPVLDYKISKTKANMESLGVNVESLTLTIKVED